MATCEKCGLEIPFGAPICPNCGGQGKKEVNIEEDNKSCPACGANIEEGQKFCIKCGQHLDFSKINKKVPIGIEDETVATYQGAQNKEFEVELLEGIEPKKELAEAVKECVSREGKIIPQTIEEGWLCSCETYNSKDFEICTKCGTRKEDVLKITSEEGREEILAEYREKTVARNKRTAQSKRKFKKWAAIGIGVTVIIFAIVILIPFINPKYLSEQEMLNVVRGTYSNNEYYADEQIIINSVNIVTFKRYNAWEGQIETERVDVTKWDYRNGSIKVDGKRMFFNAQGDLICNGEKYSKGGELYIPENSYSNDSYYEDEEPSENVVESFYDSYFRLLDLLGD